MGKTMIDREKFYKLIHHKLDNVEELMIDRLTELIRSNGGSINFFPNDNDSRCHLSDEVINVELDKNYFDGIKIQFGDGTIRPFRGESLENMEWLLVKCENWIDTYRYYC